ncbi:hypoxanthine-guanine phosphoribosyltransferase [Lysinibacillus parviboronicapiens]|uniref:Hypoxanthine-guanine phosphoribosyltransferase n=1 Tax=Lysinibacillus parviboronicapiens TaxID=436516 RepID=A0ABV2PLS0_9BACI|nr:phosphoribosyltransferase family protein [Lysinibacillus parviboronicapiens]
MPQLKSKLNIFQDYEIEISITNNPYDFAITDLFKMATRINKKRQFLFVSTVLGKHLAVRPQVPILTGTLLAMMYHEKLVGEEALLLPTIVQALKEQQHVQEILQQVEAKPLELLEETLFIGFAETATALGHAVFNAFGSRAMYIHTTREFLPELEPFVTFEEEHSHATSHRVYCEQPDKLLQAKRIVLIDDEITTGNTVVNIIETLRQKFPDVKHYSVLSILDWRSAQQHEVFQQMEKKWDVTIDFVAMMGGQFSCSGEPYLSSKQVGITTQEVQDLTILSPKDCIEQKYYRSIAENGIDNKAPYMLATGRFMLTTEQQAVQKNTIKRIAQQLKKLRSGGPALVIGTGEFMYVPMQIASYLGEDVYIQSTTRSPIYCAHDTGYTITEKIAFECPENNGVENYLYNVQSHPYSELFLVVERIANKEVIARVVHALQSVSDANIYVICMHELEGE